MADVVLFELVDFCAREQAGVVEEENKAILAGAQKKFDADLTFRGQGGEGDLLVGCASLSVWRLWQFTCP